MKKSGKLILMLILIVSLLLVSSCSRVPGGERPSETAALAKEVQSGTQGVELEFVRNTPPNTIYDQNELISLVEVRNRGNYDLQPQDCVLQITGFDPSIIRGDFNFVRSCTDGIGGALEGKKLYNVEGGFNQVEFRSTSVSLPEGVFEYSPQLNYLACYVYRTRANPLVCVDPLLYQVTAEQRTCTPNDVSMGGGQGGPVGISYVGVDMVGSKAIFEINVVNFGSGRVISRDADIRNCGQSSLSYTDLDKVYYNVEMNSGGKIDCKPRDGYVRLVNGNGKMVCSFNVNGGSAYETPLMIELDYGYVESYTKNINIIRTPE